MNPEFTTSELKLMRELLQRECNLIESFSGDERIQEWKNSKMALIQRTVRRIDYQFDNSLEH